MSALWGRRTNQTERDYNHYTAACNMWHRSRAEFNLLLADLGSELIPRVCSIQSPVNAELTRTMKDT